MPHIVLMAFVDTATLCLKLWDAIINTFDVKKLVLLYTGKKIRQGIRMRERANHENNVYKKMVITSLRFSEAIGQNVQDR